VVPRLIIVSNRVAVPGNEAPRQAGGFAVAVNAALKQREGIWFGWSGRVAEDGAAPQPTVVRRQRRTFITLDLSSVDFQEYYNGFANRVLWPILHYRVDLAEFTSAVRLPTTTSSGCRPRLTPTIFAAISRYGTASQDLPAKRSNSAAVMCTFARFPSLSILRPMLGSRTMP